MTKIAIYRAEADVDGLVEQIQACSSVAYHSPLQKMTDVESGHFDGRAAVVWNSAAEELARASFGDLYPTKSVLASTTWNLNDDVFDRIETWIARSTPVNKPTNVDHIEDQVVGHMTTTWAMDDEGKLIDFNAVADELPNKYHLCNGAVIYTHWQKEDLVERTTELIEAIEAGEKFVSMECTFTGFDYALKDVDGTFHIVARNEETAFLTKHLRAYGGTGEYDGNQVGRLLRNITFSAKGYVDRPANPESIIFSDAPVIDFNQASYKNPFTRKNGVLIKYEQSTTAQSTETETENSNMSSELDIMRDQLAEAKEAIKALTTANEELKIQAAAAGVEKFEAQIADLTAQVEAAAKCKEEDEKEKEKAKSEIETLQTKVDELTKANEELTEKVTQVEAEKQTASRVSTLVDGGVDKEGAEASVEKFANLDDEQFSVVASALIDAAKAKSDDNSEEEEEETSEASESESEEEKDETGEANANEETLENAEASEGEVEGAAAADDKDTEIEETRKGLAAFIRSKSRFAKKSEDSDESDE